MQTIERREAAVTHRPRRQWWILGLSVLVACAIGAGIWALVVANQSDDIDIATDLVDDWIAGWNASDPDAIAGVFTGDAREAKLFEAQRGATLISNVRRTSELTATDTPKTFSFTTEHGWAGGRRASGVWMTTGTYTGLWEITLEGDLASAIEGEWSRVLE